MSETLTEPLRARKRPKSKKMPRGRVEEARERFTTCFLATNGKKEKNLELTVTAEKRKLNGPRN